jgi:hypothetical protein
MPQVICAFFSAEARQEQADYSVDSRNGSRFDATQKLLEFAICHLDRVEVRGVFRQVPKRCPSMRASLRRQSSEEFVDGCVGTILGRAIAPASAALEGSLERRLNGTMRGSRSSTRNKITSKNSVMTGLDFSDPYLLARFCRANSVEPKYCYYCELS